jgi:hypothetical protein
LFSVVSELILFGLTGLTLFIVVDETHFSWIGFGLADGDGRRVRHGCHRGRWHHQCRHDVIIKLLGINFDALSVGLVNNNGSSGKKRFRLCRASRKKISNCDVIVLLVSEMSQLISLRKD